MIKIIVSLLLICNLVYSAQDCAKADQECGGIKQVKCCSGAVLGYEVNCKYHTPIHPEATGVCLRVCQPEGEFCGGFTQFPRHCCEGLECKIRDNRIPDLPGNCTKVEA